MALGGLIEIAILFLLRTSEVTHSLKEPTVDTGDFHCLRPHRAKEPMCMQYTPSTIYAQNALIKSRIGISITSKRTFNSMSLLLRDVS